MKKILLAAASVALLSGCQFDQTTVSNAFRLAQGVSGEASREARIGAGIKEALAIGSERAATSLSAAGGYGNNPVLRIALPDSMQPVTKTLRQFGMGSYVDKVEADMNRAAELAAVKAVPVFKSAVTQMTLADAVGILNGSDRSATEYFRSKTEANLRTEFAPIIRNSLQQTGYYDSYRQMLGVYEKLPLANKPSIDLEQYVLNKSLSGLFFRLGEEETLIRRDPAKRTTALLQQVFGNAGAAR